MKSLVATFAALLLFGTSSVIGQASWEQNSLQSGAFEYRLTNDDGVVIILACETQGVVAGFEFPEPLDNPSRATIRSIPGGQENVPVTPVSDRVVRITGDGIFTAMRMIRDSSRLFVRMAGESTTFITAGSGHIVSGCLARQEALPPE